MTYSKHFPQREKGGTNSRVQSSSCEQGWNAAAIKWSIKYCPMTPKLDTGPECHSYLFMLPAWSKLGLMALWYQQQLCLFGMWWLQWAPAFSSMMECAVRVRPSVLWDEKTTLIRKEMQREWAGTALLGGREMIIPPPGPFPISTAAWYFHMVAAILGNSEGSCPRMFANRDEAV